MKKKITVFTVFILLAALLFAACGKDDTDTAENAESVAQAVETMEDDTAGDTEVSEAADPDETADEEKAAVTTEQSDKAEAAEPAADKSSSEDVHSADSKTDKSKADEPVASASPAEKNSLTVAIDPGHQRKGNSTKEPIGLGSSESKAKVASGTSGKWSGLAEYELTLDVSLLLRDELESRGYTVVMTRETHDVDISNKERTEIASDAGADIFVRIHANGSDDASTNGAMTICMTKNSPYC